MLSKIFSVYELLKNHLESGNSARSLELEKEQLIIANELQLLTIKPVLYLCNVDESSVVNGNKYVDIVKSAVSKESAQVLILGAGIEADISELDTFEERKEFLNDIGLDEPGVSKLIRYAYSLLNLQTYFTAGVKEVRAWTIKSGATAPQAAGEIHTDFEKGFIRAETIGFEDFINYSGESGAKEAGKLKSEGSEYIVKDGDIMHFRFNV